MKNHLPIGERHVQSAFHRGEIIAAFRRIERRACQLAVQNFDAVFRFHHFQEFLQIIGRDLVSESATAAVKHHHDLVRNGDPEFFCKLFVAHVLRSRDLHLEIMITAAEGADLIVAALNRAVADFRCVRASDATVLLGEFEVFLPAEIVFNTPARALLHQIPKIAVRKFQKSMSANARRHALEKPIDNLFQMRLHVIERQVRGDEAHAAVDVEPNATGRDDAAFVHVHRRNAADGESVTTVAIRHAKRVARDARQHGHVADLLVNRFVHFAHQFFCRDDPSRHAHALLVSSQVTPKPCPKFFSDYQ